MHMYGKRAQGKRSNAADVRRSQREIQLKLLSFLHTRSTKPTVRTAHSVKYLEIECRQRPRREALTTPHALDGLREARVSSSSLLIHGAGIGRDVRGPR